MSRQDDFIEAGIQNHIHHCPQMLLRGGYAYAGDKEKLRSKIFEEAAEYGFQYAKKRLREVLGFELDFNVAEFDDGVTTKSLVDKILKRMEE